MTFDGKQLGVLVRAAFRDFTRDKLGMVFSYLFPLMFVVITGTAIGHTSIPRLKVGVEDRAVTARSQRLVGILADDPTIQVRRMGVAGGAKGFRSQDLDGMIVIPAGALTAGAPAVQVVTVAARKPQLRAIVEAARARFDTEVDGRAPAFAVSEAELPVRLSPFTLFVPGLLALALLQLGLYGTATPLVMARQKGTLRQLCLTPVRTSYLLLAQVIVRGTIAMTQIVAIMLMAVLVFHVQVTTGLLAFGALAMLGATMLIAIGYAIAGLVPAKESGFMVITLLNFLFMFGGGVFFDPSTSAAWPLPLFLPVAYLADAGRQLLTGAPGMVPLWATALAMVGFTGIAAVTAIRTFRFAGGR